MVHSVNAVLRSSRTRMLGDPESAAINRSLVTLIRAVSVLCASRKSDWKTSYRLLSERCDWNCEATTFSRTLARNGRLEIGLELERSCWSRFGFFNSGVTTAVLKWTGTSPVCSDLLISVVRNWTRVVEQAFNIGVGIGSREQLVGLELLMMARSADVVTSSKLHRMEQFKKGEQVGGVTATVDATILALMSVTLALQKAEKRLHSSGEAAWGPVLVGFRRQLTVENRVLGLPLPL